MGNMWQMHSGEYRASEIIRETVLGSPITYMFINSLQEIEHVLF